jgi:hypothetical protein
MPGIVETNGSDRIARDGVLPFRSAKSFDVRCNATLPLEALVRHAVLKLFQEKPLWCTIILQNGASCGPMV